MMAIGFFELLILAAMVGAVVVGLIVALVLLASSQRRP